MRIVVAGGGSGGHIYPALAILEALRQTDPHLTALYIGTGHGMEKDLVPRAGVPFQTIHARGLLVKGWRGKLWGMSAAVRGVWDAWRLLKKFRPDVVVGTGGYVSGPVGVAAHWLKIPLVIQEQNAWPGLTNRILSRYAQAVLVPFAEAGQNFPPGAHIIAAGNPITYATLPDRKTLRHQLNIDDKAVVLMVTGGSQGAAAINQFVLEFLPMVKNHPNWALFWATGKRYYHEVMQVLADHAQWMDPNRIKVVEYFYDVQQYYAAADVFLGRAGAMTLADCFYFGLPSVLVPSPHVSENHQMHNARLVEKRGAALVVAEQDLAQIGMQKLSSLLCNAAERDKMASAARNLYDAQAMNRIVSTIVSASKRRARA
ncbi:MAG: undecaprenyldiphospho-muramoylpentapeptide beta-N-acetylglucosaminyltransferase [Firmicutes bacterium]|nr:undecaprenyldiphospho-muramoylpentapeptide beta-N-acetylglucosaminyltransferase [Bacillota bacterium]